MPVLVLVIVVTSFSLPLYLIYWNVFFNLSLSAPGLIVPSLIAHQIQNIILSFINIDQFNPTYQRAVQQQTSPSWQSDGTQTRTPAPTRRSSRLCISVRICALRLITHMNSYLVARDRRSTNGGGGGDVSTSGEFGIDPEIENNLFQPVHIAKIQAEMAETLTANLTQHAKNLTIPEHQWWLQTNEKKNPVLPLCLA